jgi:transposase
MLQLSHTTSYYWYHGLVDMRKGFDALCGLVFEQMKTSVTDGGVFIFINKKRNQVKLLCWEGDGFALYYKRLSRGRYELPEFKEGLFRIDILQLQLILQGIILSSVKTKPRLNKAVGIAV